MKKFVLLTAIGAMSLCAVVLGHGGGAVAQQDKGPEGVEVQKIDGVEVLTRGPMHEAYAAPQSLDPKPAPIVPKKPPEPIPELPPDQKPEGNHVVWIGGYWAWDDEPANFVWVSGFWRDQPAGKQWIPGHWLENAGGWQWSSGFWSGQEQTQISYLPPPPPTLETGPSAAAPDANQVYAPGCWIYLQQKHYWRPGFWLRCRPDLVYVPGHYIWTPAGCIFVDGYWDYPLTRRGLLFCPIRFTANVWTRPGWRWQPRYIVYPEVIVSALFVRPDLHRYCFGDYFAPRYSQHGFVPWVDYRLHRNIPEPMFRQVAWNNRKEVTYERDLRKLYDDRRTGIAPRPPHSIAQQEQFMRDLPVHNGIKLADKTILVADVKVAQRNLTMVNTLKNVDRRAIPLTTLTQPAQAQVLKAIEHHADVIQVRKVTETTIVKQGLPLRITDPHPVSKLPVMPAHLTTPTTIVRPTVTITPKHIEKVVPKYEPPKAPRLSPKPLHSRANGPVPLLAAHPAWQEAVRVADGRSGRRQMRLLS